MLKTKAAFLKFSECIKLVKYAVKIVQKSAGMRIIMVSSVCGIVYKTSQVVPGIECKRFFSKNKFVKRDTNYQNGLKTRLNRLF